MTSKHASSNLGAVTRTGIFPHIMPNKWRKVISWVCTQNVTYGRRGKGAAESFSRKKKLRQVLQKEGVEKSCVTPAGASTRQMSRTNGMTTQIRSRCALIFL